MSLDVLAPDPQAHSTRIAEEHVVAAVLASPDAQRFASEQCSPADFAHPGLGVLYGLAIALRSQGTPVDLATIADACERRRAGGDRRYPDLPTVAALFAGGGLSVNAAHYGRIVRAAATSRALRMAAVRLAQAVEQGEEPGTVLAATMRDLTAIRDDASPLDDQMITLAEIMATDYATDWLVPGLLERGDRLMLTGGEGGGKTTFLRQVCIQIAAGIHPFTCEPIDPVGVMVIDVENTRKQWSRAAGLMLQRAARFGQRDPAPTINVECSPRIDITNHVHLGAIHRKIDQHQPDVLMIGPLYKLVPRSITSDDDAAPLITALDSIRDRGVTLLMEAHAGHARTGAGGTRDLRPRGSSALLGWPEFGHGLSVDTEDDSLVHVLRWRGDRDQRAWPRRLRRGTTSWPWVDDQLDGHTTWMRHADRRR